MKLKFLFQTENKTHITPQGKLFKFLVSIAQNQHLLFRFWSRTRNLLNYTFGSRLRGTERIAIWRSNGAHKRKWACHSRPLGDNKSIKYQSPRLQDQAKDVPIAGLTGKYSS